MAGELRLVANQAEKLPGFSWMTKRVWMFPHLSGTMTKSSSQMGTVPAEEVAE